MAGLQTRPLLPAVLWSTLQAEASTPGVCRSPLPTGERRTPPADDCYCSSYFTDEECSVPKKVLNGRHMLPKYKCIQS